jgi:hypothetical protein
MYSGYLWIGFGPEDSQNEFRLCLWLKEISQENELRNLKYKKSLRGMNIWKLMKSPNLDPIVYWNIPE